MRNRVLALLVGVLLVVMAPGASAATTFVGTARATGLQLTLMGQGLIVGSSDARMGSQPVQGCPPDVLACASARGAAPVTESVTALRPGDMGPNSSDRGTTTGTPLAQAAAVTFGPATAEVRGPETSTAFARGASGGAAIDVTLTQTLTSEIPQLEDAIDQVLTGVGGVLDQVAQRDPTGVVARVNGTLQELLGDLDSGPIASLVVGPTESIVTDTETSTTAIARASSLTLVLAPTPGIPLITPEGLVIVEVGPAEATASSNRTGATAEVNAAVARIRILDPTKPPTDPMRYTTVNVASGRGRQCLSTSGAPPQLAALVDVCVTVGGGDTSIEGSAAAARASGVSVETFFMGNPLITANVGDAVVGVNSAIPPPPPPPAQVPPTPAPTPTPASDLPRTGGTSALPALLLLGLGSSVGLTMWRRRS
jgi:hypothetical protein